MLRIFALLRVQLWRRLRVISDDEHKGAKEVLDLARVPRGSAERMAKRWAIRWSQRARGSGKPDAGRAFCAGRAFPNPAVLPQLIVHLLVLRLRHHYPHQFMHTLCPFVS